MNHTIGFRGTVRAGRDSDHLWFESETLSKLRDRESEREREREREIAREREREIIFAEVVTIADAVPWEGVSRFRSFIRELCSVTESCI